MHRQENKLLRKMRRSMKQNVVFARADSVHTRFKDMLVTENGSNTTPGIYHPFIDSLYTTLTLATVSNTTYEQLNAGKRTLDQLKSRLYKSEEIQEFLRMKCEGLQELVGRQRKIPSSWKNQYSKISRTAYYYSAEVRQYRELLDKPKKIEQKTLEIVRQLPAFKKIMSKNSELASLFRLPGNETDFTEIAGLQTRASVEELIHQKVANIDSQHKIELQQLLSLATQEFQKLKDNINEATGDNQDINLPDFKPNSQRTKTFLNRIEYGFDAQFAKGTSSIPATINIGITAGYKINDKSVAGFGLVYKMGTGSFDHIHITHEGLGVRSFLDWKMKKQIYVSGGWEMNYIASFKDLQQLQKPVAWQNSALIGLSKRYKLNKKIQGEMKLLYDFLYREHVPVSQPVLFRLGYKL